MTDTEPYTPSVAEMREYVETGGEPRPWVEVDQAEEARERFRAEAFDRMVEAVRQEEREKAARIADGLTEPGRVTSFTAAARDDTARRIAARIRAQGEGQS
ncbi:hypothetical protein N8K70_03840 [Microbacterium betulae]|uniref:Uncharacterized protein n=1 Tax=Microbacterium betulae TaxID=2981139 RepID=A0AA97I7N6_9MICO|nr:hypothetical protein [Microbacterium sp. AB]WOF23822.1 hypothetical protein N8K70_03840 [Microbacterium sp. AB]